MRSALMHMLISTHSQVCSMVHTCLTIDKPFWAAFICGYCRDNYHNTVKDYNDCF